MIAFNWMGQLLLMRLEVGKTQKRSELVLKVLKHIVTNSVLQSDGTMHN